jgi:hypothetical protein
MVRSTLPLFLEYHPVATKPSQERGGQLAVSAQGSSALCQWLPVGLQSGGKGLAISRISAMIQSIDRVAA